MKNVKVVKLNTDVTPLPAEELDLLVDWAKHPGFQIAKKLADKKVVDMAVEAVSKGEISVEETRATLIDISQFRSAIAYLLDMGNRAREELEGRRNKIQ